MAHPAMSKQTPLSQLPTFSGGRQMGLQPPPTFDSDVQRQMVTQMQAAAAVYTMPQNTQLSAEIAQDDDETIQQAFQQFSGYVPEGAQGGAPDAQQSHHHHRQQQQRQQQQRFLANGAYQEQQQQQQQQQVAAQQQQFAGGPARTGALALLPSGVDMQLALLAAIVYALVSLIPVDRCIFRYVTALQDVPYAELVVRAALIALLFLVARRLFMPMT
jgi:hypothetical protein